MMFQLSRFVCFASLVCLSFLHLTMACLAQDGSAESAESAPDFEVQSFDELNQDFEIPSFDDQMGDFGDLPDDFEDFADGDFGAPPMSEEEQAAAFALGAGMIIASVIMGIIGFILLAWVAYLLMDALNAVPEEHRQLSPMIPWLLFVPLVQIIILVLVFIKVPESLSTHLRSVGDESHGDCGKNLGLWGAILYLLGCTFPIGLVLLVMSMMKIGHAKKAIRAA